MVPLNHAAPQLRQRRNANSGVSAQLSLSLRSEIVSGDPQIHRKLYVSMALISFRMIRGRLPKICSVLRGSAEPLTKKEKLGKRPLEFKKSDRSCNYTELLLSKKAPQASSRSVIISFVSRWVVNNIRLYARPLQNFPAGITVPVCTYAL